MKIQPPVPSSDKEMLVVFNDTQLYRQCDEEALGAGLMFLNHYKDKITHFVFNGDIMDFEEQSDYAHYPDQHGQSTLEIKAGQWLIKFISDMLPKAEKVFISGNHEARWENMIKNQSKGLEEWVRPFDEMFQLTPQGWSVIDYGRGRYYFWHDRIFWHGHRAGAKSNIPKLELEDAGGISVTTAHINKNMYWEITDALGNHKSAYTHGGFSKNDLGFVKRAATSWSQGFGIYYWTELGEHVDPIIMHHGTPEFYYGGRKFTGKGFRIL